MILGYVTVLSSVQVVDENDRRGQRKHNDKDSTFTHREDFC